ncbi:MAG: glycosyltransferase, partial [Clostridia bacterium]
EARLALGLDDRPLIVSFWGSQGAREMNRAIAEFISLEAHDDKFFHIHATGAFAKDWLPQLVWQSGVELSKHTNIELREYINDMPKLLAAADLVMCRGGASTISELAACAVPAIIVPSPNVAANHQETNARVLSDAGGAVVILEKDAPGRVLYDTACELLCDAKRLRKMSRALTDIAVLDGTERILNEIRALSK